MERGSRGLLAERASQKRQQWPSEAVCKTRRREFNEWGREWTSMKDERGRGRKSPGVCWHEKREAEVARTAGGSDHLRFRYIEPETRPPSLLLVSYVFLHPSLFQSPIYRAHVLFSHEGESSFLIRIYAISTWYMVLYSSNHFALQIWIYIFVMFEIEYIEYESPKNHVNE